MESILPFLTKTHTRILFLAGAGITIVGMSFSLLFMSIGTIWLASVILLEGNYLQKWNRIKSSSVLLWILLFLLLHVIAMGWTENMPRGLKELKKLLPLLAIPVAFATTQSLQKGDEKRLLWFFVISLLASIGACFAIAASNGSLQSGDPRHISIFTSHIRLSLFICLAICFVLLTNVSKVLKVAVSALLIGSIFLFQSLTGIILLAVLALAFVFGYSIKQKSRTLKVLRALALLFVVVLTVFVGYNSIDYYHIRNAELTPENTPRGNPYNPELENDFVENGSYLWRFVSYDELETSWKSKTGYSIWDKGAKDFPYYGVLIRYLNNLHYTKDADGVAKLKQEDIDRILQGNPYPDSWKFKGLAKRLRGLLFHFEKGKLTSNFTGNSLAEKIVYQTAGWNVYKKHPFLGTGTGDLKDELNEFYREKYPFLDQDQRRKAHNQYLTTLIKFGPIGLFIFLIMLWLLMKDSSRTKSYLKAGFLIIILTSFLSEDTLDTQAGLTFFSFFIGLLFLSRTQAEKLD